MFKHFREIRWVLFFVIFIGLTGTCTPKVPPEVGNIHVESMRAILVGEQASLALPKMDNDLTFEWKVSRGTLSDYEKPWVIYTAPSSPGLDTVTVTVTNEGGQVVVQSTAFQVVEPSPTSTMAPTAADTPILTETPLPKIPPQVGEISVDLGTTILVGKQANLAVQTSGTNLTFEWEAKKGRLSDPDQPWVIYTAPDSPGIDIVTVKVIGEGDMSKTQRVTFQVVKPTSSPTATPKPVRTALVPKSPTPTEPAELSLTPLSEPSSTICPPPRADGTVLPAVTISSITFRINGLVYVANESTPLRASYGDKVEVESVKLCVEPFEGERGGVYVEFDPVVDQNGCIIASEIKGTYAVPLKPGFIDIPGLDIGRNRILWDVGGWTRLAVVAVHYPGVTTQNTECENGLCEIDDRVVILRDPTFAPPPVPDISDNTEGTVRPTIAISSITFIVNGIEQVIVDDSTLLRASPGDEVKIKEIIVYAEPFEGEAGSVYVEFDPIDKVTKVAMKFEVRGTQAVPVTAGFTTIPVVDRYGAEIPPWIINDCWQHLSIVTVHYPGVPTQDLECENGTCEIDDRMLVFMQ